MRHVLAKIETFGLSPNRLMIEFTETAFALDGRRSMEFVLDELHDRGLRLAIDELGAGHSSLSRLNQMRVSMLKIDRQFIGGCQDESGTAVLTASIVQLARNLGLETLAQGIETEEQRRFLPADGCDLGQGFYFSRPDPAHQVLCSTRQAARGTGSRRRPPNSAGPPGGREVVDADDEPGRSRQVDQLEVEVRVCDLAETHAGGARNVRELVDDHLSVRVYFFHPAATSAWRPAAASSTSRWTCPAVPAG